MKRIELVNRIKSKGSFLCIGLDPDPKLMPSVLGTDPDAVFTFNKAIIDATAQYCIAYKPNTAFYECLGLKGWETLSATIRYIKDNYLDHFVIADAKRGDIGNTSRMYARAFFEEMQVDAVTVAPYMGQDSVQPFLDYEGKWTVLLALTSNKSAEDFEMINDKNGHCIYERVLRRSLRWGNPVNMMYVVGATRPEAFETIRKIVPRHFLLVPGVGAQGGSLEDVCKYGLNDECGLIVNSSRAIIYASNGENYAQAAATKARNIACKMAEILRTRGLIDECPHQ